MQTKWKREKSKLQLYREQFISYWSKSEWFSKDEIERVDLVQIFFPFFNRRNERRESMELQAELNRQERNSYDWPQRNA